MNEEDEIEELTETGSPATVILVHGTWAYGRWRSVASHWRRRHTKFPPSDVMIWTNATCPNSFRARLSSQLPAGTRVVGDFAWTGYNGLRSRREAASKLAARIDSEYRAGASKVFIVAHSHGGNVAQYASSECDNPLAGIVTMATPFISASKRTITKAESILATFLSFFLGFWVLMWTAGAIRLALNFLTAWKELPVRLDGDGEWFIPVIFGALFWVFVGVVIKKWRWLKRIQTERSKNIEYLSSSRPETPLLAIRASGDEMQSLLMIGQIINLFQRVSLISVAELTNRALLGTKNLRRPLVAICWVALAAVLMGFGLPWEDRVFDALTRAVNPGWAFILVLCIYALPFVINFSLLFALFIIGCCASIICRSLAAVASASYGFEFMFLSPRLDLQVEAGPNDRLFDGVTFSKNIIDDLALSIRHGIYNAPITADKIGFWITSKIGETP